MSVSTQTAQKVSASASISGAQNDKITPLSLSSADTEYTHALQNNLKQLIISARNNAKLQFAFKVNESNTNYKTIQPFTTFSVDALDFTSKSLYIRSNLASTVVEILEFY